MLRSIIKRNVARITLYDSTARCAHQYLAFLFSSRAVQTTHSVPVHSPFHIKSPAEYRNVPGHSAFKYSIKLTRRIGHSSTPSGRPGRPIYFLVPPKMCAASQLAADTIPPSFLRFAYSPMGVYYRNALKHCGHEAAGLNLDTLPLSTRKIRALARSFTHARAPTCSSFSP